MLVECSREVAFEQFVVQNRLCNDVADKVEVPKNDINKENIFSDLQFVCWVDIGIRIDSVRYTVVSSLGEERVVWIEHLS